jgi:nucleoside-diphosphate kinase
MAGNITLTMIKPMAVKQGHMGAILKMIADGGFRIIAMKYLRLTEAQAMAFYDVHRERPFYLDLVKSMTSGPIVAAILEKENAVEAYRLLIGPTDPAKASHGTIRHHFGVSIEANAVHGSDSDENAIIESDFFFSKLERFGA